MSILRCNKGERNACKPFVWLQWQQKLNIIYFSQYAKVSNNVIKLSTPYE